MSRLMLVLMLIIPLVINATTSQDFEITSFDGVILRGTYYLPESESQNPLGFPGIVLVHGLGGSHDGMQGMANRYANMGYAVLTYSVRGQGSSDGYSTPMGDNELRDLEYMVDYLGNIPEVNKEALAVIGGSQGGVHAWLAAIAGLPVKCVVAESSIWGFSNSWFRGDSYAIAVDNSYLRQGIKRNPLIYDAFRSAWIDDDFEALKALAQEGITSKTVLELGDLVKVPIMMQLAWQDQVFDPSDMAMIHLKLKVENALYLGAGGHGSPNLQKENSFREAWKVAWLDKYLKGLEYPPALNEGPIVLSFGPDFNHRSFNQCPLANEKFVYLSDFLTAYDDTQLEISSVPKNPQLTRTQFISDNAERANIAAKFHFNNVYWIGSAATQPETLIGMPELTLQVTPKTEDWGIYAYLYDVSVEDTFLVTWGGFTRRNDTMLNPNQVVNIMLRLTGHVLKPEHSWKLILNTLGTTPDGITHYMPFTDLVNVEIIPLTNYYFAYMLMPILGYHEVSPEQPIRILQLKASVNPFRDHCAITNESNQGVDVLLYDLKGSHVVTWKNGIGTNLNHLPAGIYLAKAENSTANIKLVKLD